ncbi:ParA family protein, partial [Nonomuraea sp. LPB2021202275-12-8]|uniref:ParA family protein n=1 Tax=Nonomuraea sp. LPB2021202275-12-8 TaxID=3120159 RepID=UPI00300D3678
MTIGDPAALIPPPPVGDELPKWMQPRVPDDYKPFALPARLCCIMQKGGSGKSTTAGCLACELALMGFRVRLWDVDAQRGGVSHWFPPQHNYGPGEPPNLLHLFRGEATPDEVTYATRVPNLYIVPSYTSLKQVELGPPPGVENVINEGIENTTEHEIDFEIMDCGPSLGQLSIAATVAAPDVIIPFKASGFDLDSLQELNRTLGLVKKRLRPDMRVVAVLLSEVLKSNLAVDVF